VQLGKPCSSFSQSQPRLKASHMRPNRFPANLKLLRPSRCGRRSKRLLRVKPQLRLSHEDKGKTPLSFGGIADASRGADLEWQGHEFPLTSPNPRGLIPSAKSAPISRVKGVSLSTDSIANTTPISKGTIKVLSCEAGTGALCSAKYLRSKAKSKASLCAKGEVTITLLPKSSGVKLVHGAELQV